MLEFESIL